MRPMRSPANSARAHPPVTGSAAQEETETAAAQDAAAQQPETAA